MYVVPIYIYMCSSTWNKYCNCKERNWVVACSHEKSLGGSPAEKGGRRRGNDMKQTQSGISIM